MSSSITILYFAAAFTATGLTSENIPLHSVPFKLDALGELLVSRHQNSNLAQVLRTAQWSVDAEMVDDPHTIELKGGEEVAIICPVSGG
ncbi:hypothetical protein BD779DRAFT_1497061 [Infundibulicybe gibba]|nr:hypothetical protein BD779DRAFT_1497061 [Infundibulicybe gibba]